MNPIDYSQFPVFELTLKGFDGATDATDHLVKWIAANTQDAALSFAGEQGWEVIECHAIDVAPEFSAGINAIVYREPAQPSWWKRLLAFGKGM